jgi:acyl CoA:acetate/3-ketoacid CoA transferase
MTLKNKIVSADEAIAIIRDGDTICVSGFVGIGTPDELISPSSGASLKSGTLPISLSSSPRPPAMARTGV